MNRVEKMEAWGEKHHPKWLDVLRILLGAAILAKGVAFISNTEALQKLMAHSRFAEVSFALAHYVAFAHLVGGLLIIAGLLTRLAIIFNLPVLIGAVIFNGAHSGFFSANNTELWLSLIVLFLLFFFWVEGSGPWSVDASLRKHPGKSKWQEMTGEEL